MKMRLISKFKRDYSPKINGMDKVALIAKLKIVGGLLVFLNKEGAGTACTLLVGIPPELISNVIVHSE